MIGGYFLKRFRCAVPQRFFISYNQSPRKCGIILINALAFICAVARKSCGRGLALWEDSLRFSWFLVTFHQEKVTEKNKSNEQPVSFRIENNVECRAFQFSSFFERPKKEQKSLSLPTVLQQRWFPASHAIQAVPASRLFESVSAPSCRNFGIAYFVCLRYRYDKHPAHIMPGNAL